MRCWQMLRMVGLVLVLAIGASSVRADDAASAIIEKSLKAVGGEKNFAKHRAATWNETGTYYGMGQGLPYTGKYSVQLPNQFRMEIQGAFVIVVNKDKGWTQAGGETKEMTKEELLEQQESLHGSWVGSLAPLREKKYKLTSIGEFKVDERTTVGVRVSTEGRRDVELYFDKETGLLAKLDQRVKAPELGGKEVNQEAIYKDYREVEGAKIAMKFSVKRDGKQFVEAELKDYKAAGKLDDSVFAEPK